VYIKIRAESSASYIEGSNKNLAISMTRGIRVAELNTELGGG
jgi:hypothetical protein